MLTRRDSYAAMYRDFAWDIPTRFNIGTAVSDAWAAREPERIALLEYRADGEPDRLTYGDLASRSNALASALRARGVRRGDRIALLLPQVFETAIAHVAIYKLGAIAVPLALLFGVEALEYRLHAAGVKAVITNAAGLSKVARLAQRLPMLELLVSVDGTGEGAEDFHRLLAEASPGFEPEDTGPDDPAMMIFTSGTTGPPKGALHGHRVLLGHLPGVQMPHEFLPQPGDLLWTPADWAWAGGLLNVLLPGLLLGVPVVAGRFERFEPEAALGLMEKMQVRNAFIPPTALRMLKTQTDIARRWQLGLRTIGSGGESLGRETYDWAKAELGITINEFYGQTECNMVASSAAALFPPRPGCLGRPVPGFDLAVLGPDGAPCDGVGEIAVRRGAASMMLGYWGRPGATAEKFRGDWMLTGDAGAWEDGYLRFIGRSDDVITSAGYRIGPAEVEDCLLRHPAVAMAAVIGLPDPARTERVVACVVPAPGAAPGPDLAAALTAHVGARLARHLVPREVRFRDALPLTVTGKIMRRTLKAELTAAAEPGQGPPP